MSSPLLNEDKVTYVQSILPWTFTGGIRWSGLSFQLQCLQWMCYAMPLWIELLFALCFFPMKSDPDPTWIWGLSVAFAVILNMWILLLQAFRFFVAYRMKKKAKSRVHTTDPRCTSAGVISLSSSLFEDGLYEECFVDIESKVTFTTWILKTINKKTSLWTWIVHLSASSALLVLACYYLNMALLQNKFSAPIPIYTFCWWTVCNAFWSIAFSPPPEPNIMATSDNDSIDAISRSFYVILLMLLDLILTGYYNSPYWSSLGFHIIISLLPVFWLLGALPTFRSLLLWIGEQLFIFVFGGTAVASGQRLLLGLCAAILSCTVIAILVAYIGDPRIPYYMACLFGYITNFIPSNGIFPINYFSDVKIPEWKRWVSTPRFFFGIFVATVPALCLFLGTPSVSDPQTLNNVYIAFLVISIPIYVVYLGMVQIQRIYIGGVIKNPFFYQFQQQTSQKCQFQKISHSIHLILAPLLLLFQCFYIIPSMQYSLVDNSINPWKNPTSGPWILTWILLYRTLRWNWQATESAILENILVIIWRIAVDPVWAAGHTIQSITMQLAIVSFILDRIDTFWNMLIFVIQSMISFMTIQKLKRPNPYCHLAFFILLLPWTLLCMTYCCLLDGPLLPVFGLPFFLPGFPRSLRQSATRENIGEIKTSIESSHYVVIHHGLQSLLPSCFKDNIADNFKPGAFFLLRFESRIVWLQILERCFDTVYILVKGLELQMTSCHTIEATMLDSIFSVAEKDSPKLNPYSFHCFQPLGIMNIPSYSQANGSLDGIIDTPKFLLLVTKSFLQTLVWEFAQIVKIQNSWYDYPVQEQPVDLINQKFPMSWYEYLKAMNSSERISEDLDGDLPRDEKLLHATVTCYCLVYITGMAGMTPEFAGAKHVYDVFHGKLKSPKAQEWLDLRPPLKEILLQSYRKAVKLSYDQFIYGEVESMVDIYDFLQEYDTKWYIGPQNFAWDEAMSPPSTMKLLKRPSIKRISPIHHGGNKHRPNLFALTRARSSSGHNALSDPVFRVGTIMCRFSDYPYYFGVLNRQAVIGFRAMLHLELLYLTNDDEERYSIQAHPILLRNMSIQASNLPLGYPIYLNSMFL